MVQNTGKYDFSVLFQQLQQKVGVEGRVGNLEHKLQAAIPALCWYFFNLNEKTIVKKKNIFIFNS